MKNLLFDLIHPGVVILAYFAGEYFGYGWVSGFAAIWFFIGREHAQAEYRWIERFGSGMRKNMPWYASFDYSKWDAHSFWWNMVIPIIIFWGLVWK